MKKALVGVWGKREGCCRNDVNIVLMKFSKKMQKGCVSENGAECFIPSSTVIQLSFFVLHDIFCKMMIII